VSNIFTKLGVTTRTAAARFAFDHGLASLMLGRSTYAGPETLSRRPDEA
jgi:hypothetical protein